VTWIPYGKPHLGGGILDASDLAKLHESNKFTANQAWGVQTLNPALAIVEDLPGQPGFFWIHIPEDGNNFSLALPDAIDYKLLGFKSAFDEDGEFFNLILEPAAGATIKWFATPEAGGVKFPASLTEYPAPGGSASASPSYSCFRLGNTYRLVSSSEILSDYLAYLKSGMDTNADVTVNNRERIEQLEAGTQLTWIDLGIAETVNLGEIWYAVFGSITYWRGVLQWPSGNSSNPAFVWAAGTIPINGQSAIACGVHGDTPPGTIGFASVFIQPTGITLGIEFTTGPATDATIEFFGIVQN
jgi:hypothetical protein